MSDQTINDGNTPASLSPEVADYFKADQTEVVPSNEEVKSDDKDEKSVVEETTKENDLEKKEEEDIVEDKKDDTQSTKDKKTSDDTKKETENKFVVAGKEYSTLDDAVKAVNSISGDNTRMSGELKKLSNEKTEALNKLEKMEASLQEYISANEEWQKYFNGDTEKAPEMKENLDEKIELILKNKQKQQEASSLQQKYTEQLDEIFKDPEFDKHKDIFLTLVDEFEGTPKVLPAELYERAKKLNKGSIKDLEEIESEIEAKVRRKIAKETAGLMPDSSGGVKNNKENVKLSPEVADYFKQNF